MVNWLRIIGNAYNLGRKKGRDESTQIIMESVGAAWEAGWRACEISWGASADLGTGDHIRAQIQAAREGRQ